MRNKRAFRWYWPWAEAKEAVWLEGMSRRGWHLARYAFGVYTFAEGEPREYLYRFDFSPDASKDWEEYNALYRDAGWEHVLSFGSWHYFRGEPGKVSTKEIYTDRESLIAKYRRLLAVLSLTFLPLILFLTRGYDSSPTPGPFSLFLAILRIVIFAVFLVLIYAVVRLLILIRKLRR